MITEGQRFLNWYAENRTFVNRAVRKNITYDSEIFDDVIGDTVVKVYNAIERGKKVKSFLNFFFICAKFNYINAQKKFRKAKKTHDNDYLKWGDIEDEPNTKDERVAAINELYRYIAEYIDNVFPSNEVDLFIIYHKLKSHGLRMSYHKMSGITGHTVSYITETLKKIKQYVNTNEDILKKKRELLER